MAQYLIEINHYLTNKIGSNWKSYSTIVSIPVLFLGVCALILRVFVCVYAVWVYQNFGLGLRKKYNKIHHSNLLGKQSSQKKPVTGVAVRVNTSDQEGTDAHQAQRNTKDDDDDDDSSSFSSDRSLDETHKEVNEKTQLMPENRT